MEDYYFIYNSKTENYIKFNPNKGCYYGELGISGASGFTKKAAENNIKEVFKGNWEIKKFQDINDDINDESNDEKCEKKYVVYNSKNNLSIGVLR